MISASAPGKVVLWGEYAVLEGATATVLAVNRYARCTIMPSDRWRFCAHGFAAPPAEFLSLPKSPPEQPAAALPWEVLESFRAARPRPLSADMNTEEFFRDGCKLGLGSSAALCVALHAAFSASCGQRSNFARALAAHRRFQGGRGSGIDVAASFFGGCQRFSSHWSSDVPVRMFSGRGPSEIYAKAPWADPFPHRCFLWMGEAAQTADKLKRFESYTKGGDTTALRALAEHSEILIDDPGIEPLRAYARALKQLDKAAGLGVYSAPHRAAERLAEAWDMAYKPCGAGGGDVGLAVADSPERLAEFAAAATAAGFAVLNLETSPHGVRLDRQQDVVS